MSTLLPPVNEVLQQFPQVFQDGTSYAGPLGAAWAPGRVNYIGEHTDYNDGFVLPLAVDRVTAFAGRMRDDGIVRLWSTQFQEQVQFTLAGLPENFEQQRAGLPVWARYVLGVASELKRSGFVLNGFDAVMGGDVPMGGGMSSSAALEVASAQAFSFFSAGRFTIAEQGASATPMQIAACCQRAEHIASGLRSGILDQAASCLGRPEKAILLDCRSFEHRYFPFSAPAFSLVVIDTNVRRELANTAYNERRQQCEQATAILRDLIAQHEPAVDVQQIKALRDITPEQFARYKEQLPTLLQRRAGYILAENERVHAVVKLLERGDIEATGPILYAGHAGLRDEYEVSCMELDTLVKIVRPIPGVLGARMMGGGFGGCTINLVRTEAVAEVRRIVEEQYPIRTGRRANIDICRAAAGPGQTTVA